MIERRWAGWRSEYVTNIANDGTDDTESLFEQILGSGLTDRETYIVHRGPECFVILNAYPYNTGHLLVLPNRAVRTLDELSVAESAELWAFTQQAVATLTAVYRPAGINLGMNLGRAAGAGVPSHLHMHVLPRWDADTNFITTVAETKVLPEALDRTWEKLHAAWPDATSGSVTP